MKGLLIKDLSLIRNQKHALIMLVVMGVLYGFLFQEAYPVTIFGLIMTILATSTISYDDFDNGYPFLLTLPFSRKQYVQEKFLLASAMGIVGTVFGTVCALISRAVYGVGWNAGETAATALTSLCLTAIIESLTIPFYIKYGNVQGKLRMYIVIAVVVGISVLSMNIAPEGVVENVGKTFLNLGPGVIMGLLLILCIGVAVVSCLISTRIMQKKEY